MNNRSPSTGYKLLISYEILPQAGQDYYTFVLGRYIPIMQKLGLQMSQAWHTAYGNGPNRFVAFVTTDETALRNLLNSDTWRRLNEEFLQFVTEFHYKVVPFKEGFQF